MLFRSMTNGEMKAISHKYERSTTYSFTKLSDTSTLLVEDYFPDSKLLGVNIDIFPLDNLTDDILDAYRLIRNIKFCRLIHNIITVKPSLSKKAYKKSARRILKFLLRNIDPADVLHKIESISKEFNKNIDSKFVANLSILAYGKHEILLRDYYNNHIYLEFEGKMYRAPIGYHEILCSLYGKDYMELPPIERRKTHHSFKAWSLE